MTTPDSPDHDATLAPPTASARLDAAAPPAFLHEGDGQRASAPSSSRVMVDPDREFVELARQGHKHAFGELVLRHKSRVFSTASRFARNHHELEDLTQDIFIKAWRHLESFSGQAPFEHWLMRLAVRACYDFLRRHRWRREHEVSRDALLASGAMPEAETDSGALPPQESERLAQLRGALQRLKPKERLVITLLEIEDRSVRDVAALTGWSEGNVKVRAHRARENLKKLLGLK